MNATVIAAPLCPLVLSMLASGSEVPAMSRVRLRAGG
jgi:hypothetical protein